MALLHFNKPKKLYAVVDVETTGGKFNEEGITEIAIYKFDGHEVIDHFSSLVNPERSIQPFVVNLTGITNEMVRRAPKFYEIAKRVIEITKDCILVAHNANFDYRMLRLEFDRLGYDFEKQTLCTVQLSQQLLPEQPSHSLGKLTKALGIPITNRHRATGDAYATVKLLKILLSKDTGKDIITTSIKKNTRKAIAKNLKQLIDNVPSQTGVYYLYGKDAKLLYIGKSKNIKKRITQHFLGESKKAKQLQEKVEDIRYELCGSELMALLKENVEIKTHQPPFNRALRKTKFSHALYLQTDDNGYHNLILKKVGKDIDYITTFSSLKSGKSFLDRITTHYDLCPALLGQSQKGKACFNYTIKTCHGACVTQESPESYNPRVQSLIEKYSFTQPEFMIIDTGRNASERSVIYINNNRIQGYAYIDLQLQITHPDILKNLLTQLPDDRDARHIVQSYLRHKKVERIINCS